MTSAASSGGKSRSRSTKDFSVSPRTSSVTRNASSVDGSAKSKTSRMLGCWSRATARASRASRARVLLTGEVRVEDLHRDLALQRGIEPAVHD